MTVRMSLTVAVAHPRVGGENAGLLGSDAGTSGSSPRGRGKQHRGNHGCPVGGLIPAWAGKTLIKRVSNEPPRAHPRVGGENLSTTVIPGVANGSSPRGRGKPRRTVLDRYDAGLIPAWAGKTGE